LPQEHTLNGGSAPMDDWRIYQGVGQPHDGIDRLPEAPPWRRFDGGPLVAPSFHEDKAGGRRLGIRQRAMSYRADERIVDMVNTAIYLRRPLLVTGKPGTGKSTLAYSIAYELDLGPVLHWSITSRSTLKDGLYRYDAIGRLQEASLHQAGGEAATAPDIGRYIHLGPLGTALLPQARPRVLLIDELDKSDIDLPNDLLNVFEEGSFTIPELVRLPEEQQRVHVAVSQGVDRVPVEDGSICCADFPMVIITSNREREFPPAFLRRCLRLFIEPPDHQRLAEIVEAHLGEEAGAASVGLIREFLHRREQGDLATDQLLNAIYLATSGARAPESTLRDITEAVLRPIDVTGPG
jgi:MoxR-like ATPase